MLFDISFLNCTDWYNLNSVVLAVAGICFVLAFCFLSSNGTKPRKKAQNGDNLPPTGPTFSEFFPDGLKAHNQEGMIEKYGSIFTVPSPLPGVVPNQVVINEPELVKELCIRQANMYRNPSNFTTRGDIFAKVTREVVGTGVTGLKGDEWQWRKRALLKEFHRNKLLSEERGLLDAIIHEGKGLCEELEKAAEFATPVSVDHLTTKAAVGVVLFFLFGRHLEFETVEMRKAAKDMIDSLFEKLVNPFYIIAKFFPNTAACKTEKKLKNSKKIIDRVVATELDVLLEEYNGTKARHPDRKEGSVMASLIANEPRFREGGTKSMLAEARVFVQAGFETTAHSLSFAMGMMAERPDLAEKIYNQGIKSFNGSTYYSADNMKKAMEETPLVSNFFSESFRLYPLAPALGGECTNDIEITAKNGAKYTLPKGTATLFLNIPLQRQLKDEPNEIRLDRWEATPSEQPFLHTFQNGPHTCPGKPLSLLEGRVFLLLVALHFKFEFPEDKAKVEYEDNGLLRPKNGMPLIVKKR
mmetsp:Transcript_8411/g.12971  ORF Transcript_8411/g.12971 Transcript_8411/m.12971 type:complete len:526 (+) Transcript_8411:43-1620(+)